MIDISGQLLKTFLNPIFIFVSSNHMQGLLMGFKLEKKIVTGIQDLDEISCQSLVTLIWEYICNI